MSLVGVVAKTSSARMGERGKESGSVYCTCWDRRRSQEGWGDGRRGRGRNRGEGVGREVALMEWECEKEVDVRGQVAELKVGEV